MNEALPTPGPRGPLGLDAVHTDDLLLDALGRGEPAAPDDELGGLLAAWRIDLSTDLPDADLADTTDSGPDEVPPTSLPTQRAGRAWRRRRIWLAAAAAAAVTVAGGTAAAAQATPGSPLFPITHVINPDRADRLAASQAIAQARQAALAGRRDDAQRLTKQAEVLVAKVHNPHDASLLRAELDEVRQLLQTGTLPSAGTPATSTPRAATTPTPGQPSSPAGPGATGNPTHDPANTPPPLLPSLPVPLPSILPSLPLGLGG